MSDFVQKCGAESRHAPVKARGKHLVVDMHCHLVCKEVLPRLKELVPDAPPSFPFATDLTREVSGQWAQQGGLAKLVGIENRIEEMDRMGVDVQAVSPSPEHYFYFTPPEVGRETSRILNDHMAEAVAKHPDRLVGMGTVALQSAEMAVGEMRRCVKDLDIRAFEIGSYVAGRELSDESLRPFFAAAEEIGVVLFMHPLGFSHGQRLAEHYLDNLIGNPIEETIAISHLIFGGVLEQLPGLKLCVAHGGGFLPTYWGRMDHAYHAREDCRLHISRPPSSYLRQIWMDTLVFDKEQLEQLVRAHGADRLCLGTDYPFDMSEEDTLGFHAKLSEEDQAKILGLNAAELLSLDECRDITSAP